jgi:N-hydroxyarylamine O-acetyltransferase
MEKLSSDQLGAYLERIGVDAAEPTLDAVTRIHRAHLETVPFESLDIHVGRSISLDLDAVFEKLVTRRRGGFCYENNSLLASAVAALGIDVALLSASVARDDGGFGPAFDHLVVRARFAEGERFLDVGFGEGYRSPMPADGAWHDHAPAAEYRIRNEGAELELVHRRDGTVSTDYRIDPTPQALGEFAEMCRYHQTSPKSGFTRQWTASLATPTGRVTVVPGRLIERTNGIRTETEVATADQLGAILESRFGIVDVDVAKLAE